MIYHSVAKGTLFCRRTSTTVTPVEVMYTATPPMQEQHFKLAGASSLNKWNCLGCANVYSCQF